MATATVTLVPYVCVDMEGRANHVGVRTLPFADYVQGGFAYIALPPMRFQVEHPDEATCKAAVNRLLLQQAEQLQAHISELRGKAGI